MRRNHDELGMLFLGIVGDAVGRLAEQDGHVKALIVRRGQFFAGDLFHLLHACLRVDHAPDFARFQRRDVDQHVHDMQVLRRIDQLPPDLNRRQRLRRKIDRHYHALLGKVSHCFTLFGVLLPTLAALSLRHLHNSIQPANSPKPTGSRRTIPAVRESSVPSCACKVPPCLAPPWAL